jgi:putative aldouronate transport system permease protein
VLPLSKPIVGVLALYYAVGYWNSYFSAMIYLSKKELQPLALYIKSVVIQNSLEGLAGTPSGGNIIVENLLSALQLKYAVIVVSVLPMLLIYPLISGNLEKGLMVGAVKS